jgi:hypothetical protein
MIWWNQGTREETKAEDQENSFRKLLGKRCCDKQEYKFVAWVVDVGGLGCKDAEPSRSR